MSTDNENKNKHRGYTEDSKLNNTDDGLEGRWSNIQADYRKKYPEITDADIDSRSDGFDYMIAQVARRTNRSKQDVENDIRGWTND